MERSNASPSFQRSFYESLGLHLLVAVFAWFVFFVAKAPPALERIEMEVIVEAPKLSPAPSPLPSVNLTKIQKPLPNMESRKIFGVSKKALTLSESSGAAVDVKTGNTISKIQDDEKMKAGDTEALPIPVDEILISSMPKLKKEIRATYPTEAKQLRKEGAVVVELLIDSTGKVRETKLIRGIGFGLDEAALEALKLFEFEPAKIADKVVAVKIRYTYKFVLEE